MSTLRPEDVSPLASAALTRGFDAGQIEFRLEDEPRIVFPTDAGFQAWFLAELDKHEQQTRAKIADEIEANAERVEPIGEYDPFGEALEQVLRFLRGRT